MSNTDSEILRALADKLNEPMVSGVCMPFDSITAKVHCVADLRRIASDLKKREAPSDEEKDREPLSKDERLKLARYFTERYTVDEMADFTTLLIRDMKVSDQLTSALASRDYYKKQKRISRGLSRSPLGADRRSKRDKPYPCRGKA